MVTSVVLAGLEIRKWRQITNALTGLDLTSRLLGTNSLCILDWWEQGDALSQAGHRWRRAPGLGYKLLECV